jgi:hypothetical protein
MREMRNANNIFTEKPAVRRLLGKPRYRGEDIKRYLKETECEGVFWIIGRFFRTWY